MDMWLFYEATHSGHAYLNPISEEAVREMESHLGLRAGVRVLDIAAEVKAEKRIKLSIFCISLHQSYFQGNNEVYFLSFQGE